MAIIKTVNAEGGSDARYDVSQMTPEERVNFDGEGRPLGVGFPDQDTWTPGLPGARGGDSQYSMGGGGGGGGAMDAYTQQLQSLLNAQSQTQKGDTLAAIRQAIISSGIIPQGFQDSLGALDQTTIDLAKKNNETGISGYARMLQDKQDAERQMLANLSSRGLRRSGAKGYLGRRAQLNWDRQSADATAALLSDIGGKQRAFADSEAQRKMQMLQALFSQSQSPSAIAMASPAFQKANAPQQFTPQGAAQYWAGNPAPTYTSPTTGQQWYGGFGGLESTPFKGKAADGLS